LNFPDWKAYYDIIQTNTNAIVGASNDMTGNIQYGGDWVMESTGTDIELIYFTSNIGYYKYLLGTISDYTIVISDDFKIYGCGDNGNEQLGIYDKSTLTTMKNTTGKTLKSVSCGGSHTIALTADGSVYGCGYNGYGQLGDDTTVNKSTLTPMTIPTGKTPVSVTCGGYHTIVLMTDGSVYGCGFNGFGQLGDGTLVDKNTLTQMTNNTGKTPKSVSSGGIHTIVLMTDGSVYGCGYNGFGQLGDGTTTQRNTLTLITNINKIFIVLDGNFIFFPSYFSLSTNIESLYVTTYSTYSLNTVPIFYYIYNVSIFQNTTLYMHGTRTSSNYLMNGADIGRFFQVDNFTKAIDLGAYNATAAVASYSQVSSIFSSARWIWNSTNAIAGAPFDVFLWFYYTFYYSSASNSGKINVICDNYANVYFNGVDK
jgi:hypothetical protein